MDILDVNEYLHASSEAINDDPEFLRWFNALVEARKEAQEKYGYDTGRVEGILYELYAMKLAYILDNKADIDEKKESFWKSHT